MGYIKNFRPEIDNFLLEVEFQLDLNKYFKDLKKKYIVEKLQLLQKTNYPKVLALLGGNTITLNEK